ncbi:hypothetical protein PVK06_005347 [Gossypium arboreum]|uniref:Uncharacterized protein n=1 Tax=Gossypium arboreum TaxID=29729 RepID=A0ABR0QUD6_GOSAR|nr:hypothetical protein PVK06_005347 [Gossypium arboreum]
MLSGLNWIPHLSVFWWKDGDPRHTFHLLCSECTLEDVGLKFNLPVDEELVTGLVASVDWTATCEQLLRKVSNKFRGSWIEMRWLEGNFKHVNASRMTLKKNNSRAHSS